MGIATWKEEGFFVLQSLEQQFDSRRLRTKNGIGDHTLLIEYVRGYRHEHLRRDNIEPREATQGKRLIED